MNAGIISQARMGSERLPGKVLKQVCGVTMLEHHLRRLAWSGLPVCVATTVEDQDDVLEQWCVQRGIDVFRGSEHDVLDRFYQCATQRRWDVVVRVTSDCPFIDGYLIRHIVDQYLAQNKKNIFAGNTLQRTYPRGLDFEIFSYDMLAEAYQKTKDHPDREHVTPYFYRHLASKFLPLSCERAADRSSFRITLDTIEDFQLIEVLLRDHGSSDKSAEEIIAVLEKHSYLLRINAHVAQRRISGY